jgi:hypothetical protein
MRDRPLMVRAKRSGFRRLAQFAVLAFAWVAGASAASPAPEAEKPSAAGWRDLSDRKNLRKWEVVEKYDFRRHGKVDLQPGQILLEAGSPGTAARWTGEFPRIDYEVTLDGKRVKGQDFFCGMTFPVGQKALTLVVGGWGGQVTGLSSIDDEPAVENETCNYVQYQQDRWYRIRVRVTRPKVEVWLDQEKIIDLETANRKLSIYWEVEPCLPFGIATWRTTGALRNIRVRSLPEGGASTAGEN